MYFFHFWGPGYFVGLYFTHQLALQFISLKYALKGAFLPLYVLNLSLQIKRAGAVIAGIN